LNHFPIRGYHWEKSIKCSTKYGIPPQKILIRKNKIRSYPLINLNNKILLSRSYKKKLVTLVCMLSLNNANHSVKAKIQKLTANLCSPRIPQSAKTQATCPASTHQKDNQSHNSNNFLLAPPNLPTTSTIKIYHLQTITIITLISHNIDH
jgi:hypothetical protein